MRTGLWRVPLLPKKSEGTQQNLSPPVEPTTNDTHIAHSIPNLYESLANAQEHARMPDLINVLHATAFSPAKSTWIKAIRKGFFQTWPGLNSRAVRLYLDKSIATAKGHLDQTRKM